MFGAIVHHVPGSCLLGIGGAPYISHKIMAVQDLCHSFCLVETGENFYLNSNQGPTYPQTPKY